MEKFLSREHDYSVSVKSKFPAYFQICTTRACNARCAMCPHSMASTAWGRGEINTTMMSDDLFDKIVEEISLHTNDVRMIALYGPGEPTTDPKIAERVKRLKDIGVKKVNLSTNGQLLNDSLLMRLIDAKLDELRISMETLNREKYSEIRVGINYDTVMKNINNLLVRRDQTGADLKIRMRTIALPSLTSEEIEEWREYWKKRLKPTDEVDIMPEHNWADKLHEGDDGVQHVACISPFTTMAIDTDGIVPICSSDVDRDIIVGDVNCNSIYEVFNGEKYKRIRELHKAGNRGEIKRCRYCTEWVKDPKRTEGEKEE